MRIMGIDPGLADVGYGIIERKEGTREAAHIAHGVVRTRAGEPTAQRLDKIYRELFGIIRRYQPNVVVVEELFFAANMKTAIAVAQGRGAAILATAQSGAALEEYTPLEIKLALVGHGRASKRQVQMMVRALLALKEIPEPDHAADALAAALCHLHAADSIRRRTESLASKPRPASQSTGKEAMEESNPNKLLLEKSRSLRKRRR